MCLRLFALSIRYLNKPFISTVIRKFGIFFNNEIFISDGFYINGGRMTYILGLIFFENEHNKFLFTFYTF